MASVKELDKVQAKLLKSALGLPKFCHNTPLLQALKVKKIDNLLQVQQLSLIRNALLNKSKARTFYLHMFKQGRMQDFSGGGGPTLKFAACREQLRCEPSLGGFGGMLPQENF